MFFIVDTRASMTKDKGGETHFLVSLKVEFGSVTIFTPFSFKLFFALPFPIPNYS